MRTLLLGCVSFAAIALSAAPAGAGEGSGTTITFGPGVSIHSGFGNGDGDGRRRHRGSDGVLYVDRDYQGDTLWRPDSFNDWWHEQPNRSYPAWVQRNQKCERIWWSGEGWRC